MEVHEVDLSTKSEEFLSVSPYEKFPVLSVNGISLYGSNIVNEYLDDVAVLMFLQRISVCLTHNE